MLTLLLGTDWVSNRQAVLEQIAKDVQDKKENRILLVPELISHDTERRLAAVAGNTASRYAQVLSFTRLGRRVMDLVGNGTEECLDNCGRIVAMASAARQLHSVLKTYAAVETKPEFLMQVLDGVDEFKRCCISVEDLKNASLQTEGLLSQKLQELALLMEGYDSLCSQGKRDPRDQMTWVLEQLEQIDFASRHVFYVDGFPDLTRQNMAILEHIIRSGTDITVSLNCDRMQSTEMAYEKAGQTAFQLWKIGKSAGVEVHIQQIAPRDDDLQLLRQSLFSGRIQPDPRLQGKVRPMRASSVYQECQGAAQQVMELVCRGERYRDVAVVCTQIESYGPILRLIFGKYGIPIYLTGTENVLGSGVIGTIVSALDAALGGLEQQDVLQYLRSTLSPLEQDRCDRLENYAYIWSVSGKQWTLPWENHPQGLSERWTDHDSQELEQLNSDRAMVIEPLCRLRDHFRKGNTVGEKVQALYGFLEEIRFGQRLEKMAQEQDRRNNNRTAQIYHQLWDILLGALEQLYDVLGMTSWDDDTFVRLLKLLLSQCDVGTIPPVLDAVNVGSVTAMRCGQQKHMILLGANEGALPGYGGSRGLLTDQDRVTLRSLGVPLTGGAMEGLQEEFAEIYGVFCGAEETVTIFTSDSQSSFVYRRLAALAGTEQQVDTVVTAMGRRPMAAGACLAACRDEAGAEKLGVREYYDEILRRMSHSLGTITREHIQGIYGEKLRLSASQVDKQAECRLAYFLKYGLRANERKPAKVDPAEFGTYVHAVLEETCQAVKEQGGFHQVTLEQTMQLAGEFSDRYLQEHFSSLKSDRMNYLFRRNVQELDMVVEELWQELSRSLYEPDQFELKFDVDGKMPAVQIPSQSILAELRGFVDRVDVWPRGESTYFRVVDYKTGKKDFDYCDVLNGVGLQMLIYLFALEQGGQEIIPGKRVSAGVQYFPARVPYLSVEGGDADEDGEKKRKTEWKRKGLLLADESSLRAMDPSEKMDRLSAGTRADGSLSGDVATREQMDLLSDYMMTLLGKMADEIASGNVEPNPYTRGTSHNACTFCPYGAVCHQETVEGRRNYKAVKAGEFWEQLEKEASKNGGRVD